MNDINTLVKYRRRGVVLTESEKLRLYQHDHRIRIKMMKVLRKAKYVLGFAGIVELYRIASYAVRGYHAVGAEILFPLVVAFGYWIWKEGQEDKKMGLRRSK